MKKHDTISHHPKGKRGQGNEKAAPTQGLQLQCQGMKLTSPQKPDFPSNGYILHVPSQIAGGKNHLAGFLFLFRISPNMVLSK